MTKAEGHGWFTNKVLDWIFHSISNDFFFGVSIFFERYKVVGRMGAATSCISFDDEVDNVGDWRGWEETCRGDPYTPFRKRKKCSSLGVETAIKWNFGFLFLGAKPFFIPGCFWKTFFSWKKVASVVETVSFLKCNNLRCHRWHKPGISVRDRWWLTSVSSFKSFVVLNCSILNDLLILWKWKFNEFSVFF